MHTLSRHPFSHLLRIGIALTLGILTWIVAFPKPADAALVTPFAKVFSTQTNGSILVTGNSVQRCAPSTACTNALNGTTTNQGNNQFFMQFQDLDTDATTSNSAMARITVPTGGEVLFAGLYWGAATVAGTGAGAQNAAATRAIKFKTPGQTTYTTLAPGTIDTQTAGIGSATLDYSAFRDVTSLVQAGGTGEYWGADISAATGTDRYAGWSLVVVVSDPAAPLRDLSVFNGYARVTTNETVPASISGFLTPPTGAVNAKVGTVAYEGDVQLSGDFMTINGQRLGDALSPTGNFFASRISRDGVNLTDRTPNPVANLGVDAKVVDAVNKIPNGATSAPLEFSSTGDFFYPAALTTQVDLFAPKIEGTKDVVNLSGNSPAKIGDTLEYTVTFTNTGDDTATNAVMNDPLPPNTTYVPGSLRVTAGANTGAKTDATGDDQGEYVAASRLVRVRVGTGANGTTGGTLVKNASTTVKFRVTLDLESAGTSVINRAELDYRALTINNAYTYDTANTVTPVTDEADLAITKTATPEPVRAGDDLTYTVTVTNNGPNPATSTVVSDTLPANAVFVSADPAQGSCPAPVGGVLTCNLGTLADNQVVPIEVVVTVPSGFTGSLTNVANVTAATSDPDLTNNSASVGSTTVQAADLVMNKTVAPNDPRPGQSVTYTLTTTNDGPSDAQNVRVGDSLPAALTGVSASIAGPGACTVVGNDVSCTRATLPSGQQMVVTVTATLPAAYAGGPLTNTANVISDTPDPALGNNSDDATVTPAAAQADLVIVKTTTTNPVVAGLPISYTITVTNNGPSDATGVTVTDDTPPTLTGVGASATTGTCVAPGGTVSCDLGTVAAGASTTVTVTATVASDAQGAVANTASVDSLTADPDDGNNSSSTTDPIQARADLALTKTATPQPVIDGNPVTYTLTVTNNGPSTSRGVELVDPVPAPLTFVSANASQGTCAPGGPGNDTVTCDLGDLASGASATVTVVADTPPDGGADGVVNTATVSAETPDPNATNNEASYTLLTGAQANIRIEKTTAPNPVIAGEQVTYTLQVFNDGPSDATGIEVVDTVPASVSIDSVSLGCVTAGQEVTCTRATLADGASATFTIVGTVSPSAPLGPLGNTATVSSETPEDPTTSDNTSTSTVTVDDAADLSVVKDLAAPGTRVAGEELTYTLTVDNDGPSTAYAVVVTDTLPAELSFVSGTGPGGITCALQPGSSSVVECAVGDLAPGDAPVEIEVTALLSPSASDGATVTNTAQVSSPTDDPNPDNDTDSVDVVVDTSADLTIEKSVSPTVLQAGLEAIYTVVVTNNGPSDAQDVSITDDIPPGVTVLGATTDVGTCALNPAGTVGTCERDSLAAGSTWTVQVRVLVDPDQIDPITNTAIVDSATEDPEPDNNDDTVVAEVETSADIAVVKTASPDPLVPGQLATYTLTVTNTGPSAAQNVTLADTFDPAFSEITVTSPASGCTVTGQDLACALDVVEPGTPVVVTVTALLDADYSAATIENAAQVDTDTTDPNPANNEDDVVTDVEPLADVSIAKRSDPTTVTAGSAFSYVLTVTNIGPSTARGVEVTDTIPDGVTALAATFGDAATPCEITGQDVVCDLDDLAPGQVVVRIDARVDADFTDASVTNEAAVTADTPDPDPADNDSEIVTPIVQAADLSIVKARTSTAPVAGAPVTWTLTVTNNGPSVATAPAVTDSVPAVLTAVSATRDDGGTCAVTPANAVSCTLGDLDPAEDVVITITGQIPADYTGSLDNTALVSSVTPDPDGTDNSSTTTDTVAASADVSIVKEIEPAVPVPGQPVTYTLTVQNAGPSVALDVTLADDLNDDLVDVVAVRDDDGDCAVGAGNTVACDLGDLAPNATVVITVTADLPADFTGDLDNTATAASPTTPDPDEDNNTSTVETSPVASADVSIDKALTPVVPVPGESVSYELTVANAGPSDAVGVVVSDQLPDVLENATVTPSDDCAISATNVVTCALGTLEPAGEVVVTITADLPADFTGDLENTATVDADTADPDLTNNESDADGTAAPSADVSIAKVLDPTPPVPGESVSYELTVTNDGPSDAVGVTVEDPLAAALTGVTVDNTDCDVSPSNVVTCALGTLEPDETVVITVTADLPADFTGDLENTATVASDTSDPDLSNNESSADGTAAPSSDVSVVKTISTDPVVPGEAVSFVITVFNSGPSVARSVEVSDQLADALTEIDVDNPDCAVSPANLLTCELGDLAVGAPVTITVTGLLDAGFTGDLANTADVTTTTPDPNDQNDSSTDTATTAPSADVAVDKVIDEAAPVPGESVSWTITVTNDGPSVAQDVSLVDPVDADLTGVSASFGDPATACAVTAGNEVTCSLGDLAPGDVVEIAVTADIPADFTGVLSNTATATSPTADPDPTNNSDDAEDNTVATADLSIVKTVDGDAVPGDRVTYAITVTNDGPSVARDIVVEDELVAALSDAIVSSTADGVCDVSPENVVSCEIPALVPGASATITVDALLDDDFRGELANTATVSSPAVDPDPEDNTSTVVVDPGAGADLAVVKVVDPARATAGDVITYTIRVTNDGPSSARDVVVRDPLPRALTVRGPVSTSQGSCTAAIVCRLGTVRADASVEIIFSAAIDRDFAGTLVNEVTVESETADLDPGNNADDAVVDVAALSPDDGGDNGGDNGGDLPDTGAPAGTRLALVGGLAALLLGCGLVLAGRRRTE